MCFSETVPPIEIHKKTLGGSRVPPEERRYSTASANSVFTQWGLTNSKPQTWLGLL